MQTQAELGTNRTGISTAPKLSTEMVKGAEQFSPSSPGDETEIARVREDYAKEAEPLGHVPPPLSVKGMAKAALTGLKGESPTLFMDKLGERLGFERTGVRLYEALISKLDSFGSFTGGPSRTDLERILAEELDHFRLLQAAIQKLGGDTTALTPSADIQATLSRGILDVLVDPRTSLSQGLEAALVAELADNDSWEALQSLAEQVGDKELAASFANALRAERQHLASVRLWVASAQGRSAPAMA
jgi:rubrerythrin